MSVPQYGMPDRPVLIATGTCVFNVSQNDYTSPDHRNAPYRCMPGEPLRCSANGTLVGPIALPDPPNTCGCVRAGMAHRAVALVDHVPSIQVVKRLVVPA